MPHAQRNRAEKTMEEALDNLSRVLEKHKGKLQGISSLTDPKTSAIFADLAKKDPELRAALEELKKTSLRFGETLKKYR